MTQQLFEKIENAKGRVFNIVDFERYVDATCTVSNGVVQFFDHEGQEEVILPIVSYFGSFEIDDTRYNFAEPCVKTQFRFHQDRKVTAWYRTSFVVDAKDKEEALAIVKAMKDTDPNYVDNKNIIVYDNDLNYETMEEMTVEENDCQPTVETYDAMEGGLIYDNDPQ